MREAVALAYGERAVPVVTARGHGEVAERILPEAQRPGGHVTPDPALLAMLARLAIPGPTQREVSTPVAGGPWWRYWVRR